MSKVKSAYWDEINAMNGYDNEPDPEVPENPSFVSYVNDLIDDCRPPRDDSVYIQYCAMMEAEER
jgi:hypothetical protein